jgi:hypothetical protein
MYSIGVILEEIPAGFLGGFHVVFHDIGHYLALLQAHFQGLMVGHPAAHVPCDLETFVLDGFALILEILEIGYDVRFREC